MHIKTKCAIILAKLTAFVLKLGLAANVVGGHPNFKTALKLNLLCFQHQYCVKTVVDWYFTKKFVTRIAVMRPISIDSEVFTCCSCI